MSETSAQAVGCAKSTDGKLWLVCVAKRTYEFGGGRVTLADEQVPVVREPQFALDENGRMRSLLDDMDLFPPKVATDVIVTGHAYAQGGKATEAMVRVAVGSNVRMLRIVGERRAEVSIDGHVRFTDPRPFESVPLSWELAYGGYDAFAHDELCPPKRRNGRRVEPSPRQEGVFAYPRNKIGRGYFIDVDRDRANGSLLPQIEDPNDLLTPGRFFVPHWRAWLDAPMPGGVGWVPHTWYPRMMRLLGGFLEHDAPTKPIREMQFADGADLAGPFKKNEVLPRGQQGAAPGMAVERLRGDEVVLLQGLVFGELETRFSLPGEKPKMEVAPPGSPKTFTPESVLQTVRIDTEKRRVTLTWAGRVRVMAGAKDDFAKTQLAVRY